MTTLEAWWSPHGTWVDFIVGGTLHTTMNKRELIEDRWPGGELMRRRVAPLVWLAMPGHDEDGR